MKARFKDKAMDRAYQYLLGKTPDELLNLKIFGSIHSSFEKGFNGEPQPCYMSRNCIAYAAFVAGKETHKGEKSPSWKGGISPINERIRQSSEFNQWRKAVFTRDNFTCQKCGAKHQVGSRPKLHPHYIKSFAKYPELRFEVSNGLTLCEDCHREVHRHDNGNL